MKKKNATPKKQDFTSPKSKEIEKRAHAYYQRKNKNAVSSGRKDRIS